MRKFSRRTTIFMVALGVLLTATIAFAVSTVSGTGEFTVQAEDVPDAPQPLTVTVERQEGEDQPISEDDLAHFDITISNPNANDVTLGDSPVSFSLEGGDDDCALEDLRIRPLDLLEGETVPGAVEDVPGTLVEEMRVRLADGSGDDCDGLTLTVTVTVTGSIEDGSSAPTPVEGSGSSA